MNTGERITQLEIKISYMEDYVDKLNTVILEQNEKINSLRKDLKHINSHLHDDKDENLPNEKPPHYWDEASMIVLKRY